jgi:hypothetical protein
MSLTKKSLPLILTVFSLLFGNTFGLDFSSLFQSKGEIILQPIKGEKYRCLTNLRISPDEKIWLTDECNGNVKVYNFQGGLLRVVGEKAEHRYDFRYRLSEFRMPTDVGFSFYSKNVYVADCVTGKVSILDSLGNFLCAFGTGDDSTWCVEAYSILINKDNEIFVGGIDTNWFGLHVYTPQGKNLLSFFPMDKKLVELSPISTLRVYLSFDSEGNIWAVNSLTYCVYQFSPEGKLLRKFDGKSTLYKPPKKFRDVISPKNLEKWGKSWTPLINCQVTKDKLIILCTQIFQPFNYLLEIYDMRGDKLVDDILTNHRLLTIDQNNIFYFLLDTSILQADSGRNDSSGLKIGKFSLNFKK